MYTIILGFCLPFYIPVIHNLNMRIVGASLGIVTLLIASVVGAVL